MKNLICSICGGNAPGKQWWNQDTGYGICLRCFTSGVQDVGFTESVKSFGVPSIHHSPGVEWAFAEGQFTCIDMISSDGKSQIGRKTLEELRQKYPSAEAVPLMAWIAAKEKALCAETK